jgi:hypothetical protein
LKITRGGKVFAPVTIVLESQAELDWLTCLSNISVSLAAEAGRTLGITLTGEAKAVQMPFYNKMEEIREARS